MKKYLLTLALAFGAGTLVIADAEARRLGGGASFGRQSQNVTRQAPPARQATPPSQQQAAPAAAPAAAGAAGAKAASPWRGMLGGALLGLGLGALLTSLGFGPAMASFISTLLMVGLLAMAAMFIYRMVTRRKTGMDQQRPAYAGCFRCCTAFQHKPITQRTLELVKTARCPP